MVFLNNTENNRSNDIEYDITTSYLNHISNTNHTFNSMLNIILMQEDSFRYLMQNANINPSANLRTPNIVSTHETNQTNTHLSRSSRARQSNIRPANNRDRSSISNRSSGFTRSTNNNRSSIPNILNTSTGSSFSSTNNISTPILDNRRNVNPMNYNNGQQNQAIQGIDLLTQIHRSSLSTSESLRTNTTPNIDTNIDTNTATNTDINPNIIQDLFYIRPNPILQPLERSISPVTIRPSLEQIDIATEYILFANINEPVNYICPITRDHFTDVQYVTQIKYCKHNFYEDSILRWFNNNVHCPLCRYDIRDYIPENINMGDTNNMGDTYDMGPLGDLGNIENNNNTINHSIDNISDNLHNQIAETINTLAREFSGNDVILEYNIPYISHRL